MCSCVGSWAIWASWASWACQADWLPCKPGKHVEIAWHYVCRPVMTCRLWRADTPLFAPLFQALAPNCLKKISIKPLASGVYSSFINTLHPIHPSHHRRGNAPHAPSFPCLNKPWSRLCLRTHALSRSPDCLRLALAGKL